ncbi:hypothetical protein AFLA_006947 [Aspergillus flavus NRRL3357]|nr:hypothetical protein AFLA_006947 [Aspergillus flavus NRRL3357]
MKIGSSLNHDYNLVLFPSSTTPWEIAWRLNQVWLKNNRDPDYTVFGIGIRDSKRSQFASGDLLLGLALAHSALFGSGTEADLAKYDLSNGDPKRLKKGMAPRQSQILAQRDPKTFPEHYQAHCSSIDTVSAVLDEEVQTKHIEYFQGYGQICEPGLPLELPAHMKESILMLPKMAEMREDIQISEGNNDEEKLQAKKREYREALVRQRRADLKKYQESWIHVERDQNILNRGKGKPLHVVKDICTRAQYLIMPELARIATAMACTAELTFEEKLFFLGDLRTLCSRKEDVIYLPNEQPIEGFCPAQGCQLEIENLTKSERSAHIHECIRREKGLALQVPNSRLHFCYECMEWFLKRQWPDHCTAHLQSWQTQHCEAVKYRHTVIRPTYCPFCLWNFQNPAEERLQYWTRSGNLRQHIETKHMPEISWPVMTSICECSQTFDNERELCHHLHDVHGLKDTIWRNPKLPRKRKRTSKIEPQILSQKSEADYSKKVRFHRSPPH